MVSLLHVREKLVVDHRRCRWDHCRCGQGQRSYDHRVMIEQGDDDELSDNDLAVQRARLTEARFLIE